MWRYGIPVFLEGNQVKGARFSLPEAVNLLSALGIVIEDV